MSDPAAPLVGSARAAYNGGLCPIMTLRNALVAANWKMNGSRAANAAWLKAFAPRRASIACDVVICAPAVYLASLVTAAGSGIDVGAQDVSERYPGAFTGDIAATMLVDVGCRWVIVGHSERRQLHGESDETVAAKAEAALERGTAPDRLCRRVAGRARGGQNARSRRSAARRGARPRGSSGAGTRCTCVRAGVGHRNRAHSDAGAGAGRACRAARAGRGAMAPRSRWLADSLRWERETRQRGGTVWPAGHRWRD